MSTEEIKDIKVPGADNSLLFLWTTQPKLDQGIDVLKAWGYLYRSCMIWVKDSIGMGLYFRNKHEILLLGKRGDVRCPAPSDRPASVFYYKKREHSQKPDYIHNVIEDMYPDKSKIELFARRRREGWAAWGNQLNDTTQTTLKKLAVEG